VGWEEAQSSSGPPPFGRESPIHTGYGKRLALHKSAWDAPAVVGRLRAQVAESLWAFAAVFTNRDLRRVELAFAGSELGKWLYIIALAVFAYEEGGAAAVGLVALIRTVPAAIGAPFTSLLGDRYERGRVMFVATLVRVLTMLAAAAVAYFDASAVLVYLLVGVVTLASTAFRPAQAAALPGLARTPDELTAANLASSTIATLASFIGPAAGGLLLAVTSVEVVFLLTAAVFLWGALLVLPVRAPAPSERSPATPRTIAHEAGAGFAAMASDRDLRLLMGLYCAQALVGGAFNVLVVVSAIELLDLGEAGVGWLNAAFGVGGVVGAVVALALIGRRRLASDFMFGIVLWGVPLALIGVWPEPAVAVLLLGLVGVGETLVEVAGPTLLQRSVPDRVLARVFGALEALIITTIGIGGLLAPLLIEALGIRGAFLASGTLLPVLAAVFWRRLTSLDRAHPPAAREVALLRGVPMFAPLPDTTLEQLASKLVRMRVPAGGEIFAQGDLGDRFYVVADGEVEVSIDGRPASVLGPGGFFGEIALVRDVPRTASVRAKSDVELYSLERDDFIAAVTGHTPSAAAADAVIATRLGRLRPAAASD
jgi:MFS family permease